MPDDSRSSRQHRRAVVPAPASIPPATDLVACAAAFAALGAAFGLDGERLARAEDLTRAEAVARLPLDRLADVAPDEVAAWFAAFSGDLELELRLAGIGLNGDDDTARTTLRHDAAPDDAFAAFIEEAREREASGGDALDVEARIVIAKKGLIAASREALSVRPGFLGTAEALALTEIAVFFSPEACARTLLAPAALPLWESAGLARPNGRAALVLLDAAGYLAGPPLEVIGARDLEALPWLDLDAAAWLESVQRRTRARALRDAESIWMIPAGGLTSATLGVEERVLGMERTARALAGFRERLAAMELAASVQAGADGQDTLLLRFSGEPVRACVLPADDIDVHETDAGEALSRLAAFAYGSETPDRLYIARDCLAHGFPAAARVSFTELEEAARHALPAAAATFNLYLKRQTDHYFTVRQQALDAVATYAEGVRQSVGDLASAVVSDVYKTAGLLVAVIIAALIGPTHARLVWGLGTIAYLAYLIFIVRFLLPARERRFALDGREVLDRLKAVSELTDDEKHDIWATAARANDYFRHYLRRGHWSRWLYSGVAAWIYYALVAMGLIFLLVLLSPLGAHLPLIASPAPAPVPTATPIPGA